MGLFLFVCAWGGVGVGVFSCTDSKFVILLKTMETRPFVPDRKLLARLVLIREEARNMMGGGILDERNDRGLSTLPEAEVCRYRCMRF